MDPTLLRLLLVVGLTAAVVAFGAWWRRRDGRIRTGDGATILAARHLDAVGLTVASGGVGAVLLGSPTCTPCTAVKRVLRDLQAERDDLAWVYADAADHLDLASAHRVMRVPTLFVVDDAGRVLARTSGVPQLADLRRVLEDGTPLTDGVAA
jgi:thiol-disulfide isomerase/thioredoxin